MKPFLEGKKVAAATALTPPKANAARAISSLNRPAPTAPGPTHSLEVIKEGDRIVRLIITCSCGEKTEVDCIYPLGS